MTATRPSVPSTPPRTDVAARTSWALAGLLLLLYPALRPWADESTLAGVEAWDTTAWVLSHTAAVLGLVALAGAATLDVVAGRLRPSPAVLLALGTALVLPYYGAEAYGLPMVGELARESGDVGLGAAADSFRYAAVPVTLFGLGLVLLAAAGVLLLVRRPAAVGPLGCVALGLWLVAFLPQFFGPAEVRVAHGVLAVVAGVLLALRR